MSELYVLRSIENLIYKYRECVGEDPAVIRMSGTVFEMLKQEAGDFAGMRPSDSEVASAQIFGIDIEVYECYPPERVECGDERHLPDFP